MFPTVVVNGGLPPYTFRWNDPLSQTTSKAVNLCAGIYSVIVTDANGCEITGSVVVDQMTGLEEFSEITNINLFPNPSSGKVFLEMDFNQNLDISVNLLHRSPYINENRPATAKL